VRLSQQVFFPPGGEKFDESLLRKRKPVKNQLRRLKPKHGLLWTSSIDSTPFASESWMDWCSHEMPTWIGDQAAIFDVKSSAKILHILNERDLEGLDPAYRLPAEYDDARLNYEAMAKAGYDGLHIDPRAGLHQLLYGWDVESTVWFDNSVLILDRVVDVDRKCTFDPDIEMELSTFSLKLAARRVARRWRG
jgi:hypothetical protein